MEWFLPFLAQVRICLVVIGGEISSKWRWFFFDVTTQVSCKAMCTITTKRIYCRFLVPKKNIENVRAGFALFTVVDTRNVVRWKTYVIFVWPCWTKHCSDKILNCFLLLLKNKNLDQTSRKTNLFALQRKYCSPDKWMCIEDLDSCFCREIDKSFCAHKIYRNTLSSDNARSQLVDYYYCQNDNQGCMRNTSLMVSDISHLFAM